jgi:hypothetical protein
MNSQMMTLVPEAFRSSFRDQRKRRRPRATFVVVRTFCTLKEARHAIGPPIRKRADRVLTVAAAARK